MKKEFQTIDNQDSKTIVAGISNGTTTDHSGTTHHREVYLLIEDDSDALVTFTPEQARKLAGVLSAYASEIED